MGALLCRTQQLNKYESWEPYKDKTCCCAHTHTHTCMHTHTHRISPSMPLLGLAPAKHVLSCFCSKTRISFRSGVTVSQQQKVQNRRLTGHCEETGLRDKKWVLWRWWRARPKSLIHTWLKRGAWVWSHSWPPGASLVDSHSKKLKSIYDCRRGAGLYLDCSVNIIFILKEWIKKTHILLIYAAVPFYNVTFTCLSALKTH